MTSAPKPSDAGLTDADRATADISAALASVYPLQDVNVAFRAIYAAGKAAAFEEAAAECEAFGEGVYAAKEFAAAIRALKC
jgi:hypothetical protein